MLAIVIPYFKIAFFKETLDSLAQQTSKNFRVYIGDDASPENPKELIKDYKKIIEIYYFKFPSNLGKDSLTQQWERCIEMINDESWVMILGDDDVLSKNVVEDFYKSIDEINEAKANVVKLASRKINKEGEPISEIYYHPKVQDYRDVFYSRFFGGIRSSLSEHIFKVHVVEKYKFKNFKYGWFADDYALLKFSEFGKIYSINSASVSFRISHLNISRPGYLEKEKKEIRKYFFSIIVNEYLQNFGYHQKRTIIREYEKLLHGTNDKVETFSSSLLTKIFIHCGIFESLLYLKRGLRRRVFSE